ncbi:hypothetical protein ABGB07_03885 [Micromonosporaceae bacterium B7E4]
MASLHAIRAAVKTTLLANLSGINVHPKLPGSASGTVVVVQPAEDAADFNVAMGRGTDTWNFDLAVLVPAAMLATSQDALDDYVTGAGSKSVRQIVFNNRTLGLADTDAHVSSMGAYGADYVIGQTQYVGATLRLVVHTPGTE